MADESVSQQQQQQPVSWNHIGLHGHAVGQFTLDAKGVQWKSALGLTGNNSNNDHTSSGRKVHAKSIKNTQAQWTVFGKSGHVRLNLTNVKDKNGGTASAQLRFDGFPPTDFDALRNALKSKYGCELYKHNMSSAGESFGNTAVVNRHLVFKQCILEDANEEGEEFEPRDGEELCTLDLTQVSQCVLPGNNRNEIELQFPESDTVEAGTDQLVSIRFYIPPDPDVDLQDKSQPSAAEIVQSRIMTTANIKNTTGNVICEFDENKGTFLTPRGRYKVELYEHFLRMRGNKYDYKIKYDDISRLFLLPKPDDVHMAFVIALDKPIRQGQQRYQYLVLQTTKEQAELTLNLDEETLQTEYNGDLQPVMTGSLSNLVAKTFKVIARKKVFIPGKFANANQQACVKCALRANEGHLYPLEKQFIFIHKPPVLIRFDEVESVEFQRYSGGVVSTRNFDLCVTLASSTAHSANTATKEYVFSGIDRSDYAGLYNFLSGKRIRIKNLQEAHPDAIHATDVASAAAEVERSSVKHQPGMYEEEGYDEESGDEDFDVNAKDSGDDGSDDDDDANAGSDDDDDNLDSDDMGSEIDMDNDSDLEEARRAAGITKKKKTKTKKTAVVPRKKKKRPTPKSDNDDDSDSDSDSDNSAPTKKKSKLSASPSKRKSPSKKGKKKKDPNAPKKPMTSFMLFANAKRSQIKDANPDATFGDLGKLVGAEWKAITDDDKKIYVAKAEQDKERYKEAMQNYSEPEDDSDDDKSKKQKKDPNAPKGAKSSYMFFVQEMRSKVKDTNPDATFGELSKLVGAKFKALTPESKRKFEDLATEDKQRYKDAMDDYLPPKGFANAKGKKGKAKKDPNAPKRPITAYFFFSNEIRPKIKEKQPDITFGEMAKLISEKFKELGDEEHEKFNELAKTDKKRYAKQMEAYKEKKAAIVAAGSDDDDSDDASAVPSNDDDDSDVDDSASDSD